MSILRHTPHSVTLVRPKEKRATGDNSGRLDYADPILTKVVKGLFQSTGGTVVLGEEGAELPFDATFYTKDSDIKQNDRVTIALSWVSGSFIVVQAKPKGRLSGPYSHNEILLRKDSLR